MKITAFLFFSFLFLASCSKYPDNLTIYLDESGTLTIQVVDNGQNGVNAAAVHIYSPQGDRIFNDSTNTNGVCEIGKLLQGQYRYIVYAENDNRTYSSGEYFQVIAGDHKKIETNPFLNVGDVRVRVVNQSLDPLADVNVALIPHPNYTNEDYL